jgi:hypothetical protein
MVKILSYQYLLNLNMVNTSVINIELVEVINGHVVKSQQCNLNIIEYPKNFRGSLSTTSLVQDLLWNQFMHKDTLGCWNKGPSQVNQLILYMGFRLLEQRHRLFQKVFPLNTYIGLKVARKRCTL